MIVVTKSMMYMYVTQNQFKKCNVIGINCNVPNKNCAVLACKANTLVYSDEDRPGLLKILETIGLSSFKFMTQPERITSLAVSENGSKAAVCYEDSRRVLVYSTSGNLLHNCRVGGVVKSYLIESIAFGSNGNFLAVTTDTDAAFVYKLGDEQKKEEAKKLFTYRIKAVVKPCKTLALSSTGRGSYICANNSNSEKKCCFTVIAVTKLGKVQRFTISKHSGQCCKISTNRISLSNQLLKSRRFSATNWPLYEYVQSSYVTLNLIEQEDSCMEVAEKLRPVATTEL